MHLDIPTLMLAGAFVALLSSGLLVFAWHQYREMSPALWWAASNFVLAFAITCLAFGGVREEFALMACGFTSISLSNALLWAAARGFAGRKPQLWIALAAPLVVAAICVLPLPIPVPLAMIAGPIATLSAAGYLIAAAWTIFRHPDRLAARLPLGSLILLHASVLLLGPTASWQQGGRPLPLVPLTSLFGVIHLEALIFIIGTTIFVVAGMREASELRQRRAAEIDSLTGLRNRGSFFDAAGVAVERCLAEGKPLAALVLDLDRFKAVNDGFGHATGDKVLQIFAETVRKLSRPTDVVGRIGGEEFAAVLPGTDITAAMAIAERIRKSFEAAAMYIDGWRIDGTLCCGVAAAEGGAIVLGTLMQEADAALYRAKSNGRNRVEMAGSSEPRTPSRVVRVA